MVHRVTTSGTASDNERQRVTKNDKESLFRLFFLFSNKSGTQTLREPFKPWKQVSKKNY